jgi:hypothetical protein
MVRLPRAFSDQILWPEFLQLNEVLQAHLLDITLKLIRDHVHADELCHMHHLDHTDAFWNEVDKVMPNYAERKEWLRVNGAGLDV